jgi:hypothetical protein
MIFLSSNLIKVGAAARAAVDALAAKPLGESMAQSKPYPHSPAAILLRKAHLILVIVHFRAIRPRRAGSAEYGITCTPI